MKRKYEWPTGPIDRKKKLKVQNLLRKLDKAAKENQDKSIEIKELREDIKDLIDLE